MQPLKQQLLIEDMTAETVNAVAALERVCFSSPWSLESLAGELSNPLAVYRVARLDGMVAGYIGMHHIIDEGYITNVAVSPEHRRQGVAAALISDFMQYASENKLRMLTLEVRQSNTAARALYRGFGFEDVGLRKNYYVLPTEDAVLMTREL